LPNKPPTPGAERGANRQLSLPSRSLGQKQVRHIHAGDQENEENSYEECHQGGLQVAPGQPCKFRLQVENYGNGLR